jgi:hypothetical protein
VLLIVLFLIGCFLFYYSTKLDQKTYDINLIQGIRLAEGRLETKKPEAIESLTMFLKSYKEGNEDGLLHIVHLYIYGMHPEYSPDKISALRLIQRISTEDHFSTNLKNVCKMLKEDMGNLTYNDIDAVGEHYRILPSNINEIIDEIIDYHFKQNIVVSKCSNNVSNKTIAINGIKNNNMDDMITELVGEANLETNENVMIIHNDSQNVHNHSVQNLSKEIINKLSPSKSTFDTNSKLFLEEASSQLELENVEDMKKLTAVIDSMSDSIHSKYDKSEKEIFNITFERIMNKEDQKLKENLMLMFINNILSAIEYDVIVCSTGKITRMISTFDVLDDELPDLKPDWIIKQEIGSLAFQIRESVLKEVSEELNKSYMNFDGNRNGSNEILHDQVINIMRAKLKKTCHENYVRQSHMSQTAIDNILIDYLESF